MSQASRVLSGRPYPLGAMVDAHGVNFSLFSYHAGAVEFLLLDHMPKHEYLFWSFFHNALILKDTE